MQLSRQTYCPSVFSRKISRSWTTINRVNSSRSVSRCYRQSPVSVSRQRRQIERNWTKVSFSNEIIATKDKICHSSCDLFGLLRLKGKSQNCRDYRCDGQSTLCFVSWIVFKASAITTNQLQPASSCTSCARDSMENKHFQIGTPWHKYMMYESADSSSSQVCWWPLSDDSWRGRTLQSSVFSTFCGRLSFVLDSETESDWRLSRENVVHGKGNGLDIVLQPKTLIYHTQALRLKPEQIQLFRYFLECVPDGDQTNWKQANLVPTCQKWQGRLEFLLPDWKGFQSVSKNFQQNNTDLSLVSSLLKCENSISTNGVFCIDVHSAEKKKTNEEG